MATAFLIGGLTLAIAKSVLLVDQYGKPLQITPDGKLGVNVEVTAEISDAKIKGTPDGGTTWVGVKTDAAGVQAVSLNGNSMSSYGATVANRPAANSVPIGHIYTAVNTQNAWQSNGTDWVVVY